MHLHHIRNSKVLSAAIFLAVFFSVSSHAQNRQSLTLISSSPFEKIYEWQAPEWEWQSVVIDGQTYMRPGTSVAMIWSHPGDPLLPMTNVNLDLLPGQSAIVILTDSLFSTEALQLPLCPAPSMNSETGNLIYEIATMDSPSRFLPEVNYHSTIGEFRDRRILAISLFPVQYAPQNRTLRLLKYARLKIQIKSAEYPLMRPLFTPQHMATFTPLAKIYILEEGPYEVTGAALEAAGIPLSSISPLNCQLCYRGMEQAIEVEDGGDGRFDPADRLLFYGHSRRGVNEYYDAYSDTNVYMLASGVSPGNRLSNITVGSSIEIATDVFTDTLHFEKELSYYNGDSDNDIHNSERVPGEGWVWSILNKGGSAALTFDLPAPAAGQDSALLRVRLRGTTLDSPNPDHHVTISLNGIQVHEAWFNDRNELIVRKNFNASLLRDGGNTLTVKLLADGPSERSQIYVDWFDIAFQRTLTARQGWLNLTPPLKDNKSVFISGFPDSSIRAWDLSKQRSYRPSNSGRQYRDHLIIQSGGYLDGNSARLFRDGKEVAYGYRGHNLWWIDPRDGRLLESRNFDTYSSTAQADSMAAWIQRLPEGALVAAAIRDEGSVSMNEVAHIALEKLGSSLTRSVGIRESWALLGRKGATPGSVPEILKKSQSGPAVIDTVIVFPEGAPFFSTGMLLPVDAGGEVVIFSRKGLKVPLRLSRYTDTGLINGGTGADYIIITHPLFESEALQLAFHRTSQNGWRTRVVLVEEIYDAFNHGLADPIAIRTFLRHARENWIKPAPEYLLLFGDASWDPKNNMKVANPTEYVPTWGNPVSDSWFGCLDGAGDILPDLHIGRIPVQSPEQARLSLEKITTYEATSSARWKKEFLFISGGFDFVEQNQFGQQTANLIKQYVASPPTFGRAIALNKKSNGLEEGEHRQEILDAIDSGVAWVNFIGHAGSRTWDLMFHNVDIEALNNAPRFPFITSMTCHTGRFAEPNQVSFGEHFVMAGDKGAIGFMGTSGWGYSYEDYTFLNKLFPTALKDTVRYLSTMIDEAKVRLWSEAFTNPQIRDMIYQYNLLGDPGIRLAVPVAPDLSLQPTDIDVIPEMPSEADSTALIKVRVHNFGLATLDSVDIKLLANHPNSGEQIIASSIKLPPLGRIDSLVSIWNLRNLAGAMDVMAQLDPSDKIQEVDEANNNASRSVIVLSSKIQLLFPTPFGLLPAAKTVIRLDGSNLAHPKNAIYQAQIDTCLAFDSSLMIDNTISGSSAPVFDWRPDNLLPNQLYFLRISDLVNSPGYWQVSSFKTSTLAENGWRQQEAFGFKHTEKTNVEVTGKASLALLSFPLHAESAGYSDGNFARIIVGDSPAISPHRGHNIVVVDPHLFTIELTRTFDTYADTAAANSMAALIEGLDVGKIVLAAIMDEGTVSMTERAYRALESIGSKQCRSLSARSSWAIIGRKGAAVGSVPEKIVLPTSGSAIVVDTLHYYAPSGRLISPRIGPAAAWHSFMAEADVPQTCALTFTLIGQRRNTTQWDTLRTGLPANFDVDLSAISAQAYPWLQLKADFSSSDQRDTPRLYAWQVLHAPVPDLAVTPAHLSLSADAVLSGQPVVLEVDIFNIGLAAADSVRVTFTETAPGSSEKLFSAVLLPKSLAADQSLSLDQLYIPSGKPGSRLVTIRIDGDNRINELSESNNTLTARVQVVADTLHPEIEITVDGRTLVPGDWVAARPLILARLLDDSPLDISDTLRVNLLLDGERIAFGTGQHLRLLASTDSGTVALLQFTPHFDDGEHTLEVIFIDASGNLSSRSINFAVASRVKLLRVMNYPNPMAQKTDFTFELTQPAEVRIRIYTVNGRLIRALEAGALGAGFNSVFWDGLDGDGDLIANGVYLYRVDAVSGEEHVQVIEKCIVMR